MPESTTRVDIVIPVYNEERDLERSITRLREFLQQNCPYRWRIVVADNASKIARWRSLKNLLDAGRARLVTFTSTKKVVAVRCAAPGWIAMPMSSAIWTLTFRPGWMLLCP